MQIDLDRPFIYDHIERLKIIIIALMETSYWLLDHSMVDKVQVFLLAFGLFLPLILVQMPFSILIFILNFFYNCSSMNYKHFLLNFQFFLLFV